MKYGIITIGSQGDIDPFIALGKRLQSRGHHVRIAALRKFENYIETEGFEYAPLAGDAVEVIQLLIGEQASSFQYFRNLDALFNPIKNKHLTGYWLYDSKTDWKPDKALVDFLKIGSRNNGRRIARGYSNNYNTVRRRSALLGQSRLSIGCWAKTNTEKKIEHTMSFMGHFSGRQ